MKGIGLGILLSAACSAPFDAPPDCSDDRCQSAASRDELLDKVSGFGDPISGFLRDAVQDDGTLVGDYRQVLDGVGELMGCAPSSERSFMVLSNDSYHAKSIFNRCASSPTQASEFFLLLPSLNTQEDFEPGLVHMTAWDDEAQRYRRYSTFPNDAGGMNVNVEPEFCLGCHGGSRHLDTWQPLMNVMTNPWSQWNAQPGFESHEFDEYLAATTQEGSVFAEVSAEGISDSASNFEPIIRAGIDRVTGARIQRRHDQADVEETLALLQPLFCDEMVNFVSEIHGSGVIRSSAIIDDSFREVLTAMGEGGEIAFVSDTTMRLPPRQDSESNLSLVAVRGESSLRAELSMMTRQVLSPLAVLQVRSLDWRLPVDSQFRCELFDAGSQRIRDGAGDASLAALASDATNLDLAPSLLAEIMTIDLGGERVSLQPETGVYNLPDAAALAQMDAAALQSVLATPGQLALELQDAIDQATRESLDSARRSRACRAREQYKTAPIVPDLICP